MVVGDVDRMRWILWPDSAEASLLRPRYHLGADRRCEGIHMTSSGRLRVGLLGAGRIGQLHANLLTHSVEGCSMSVVHDVDHARARSVAGSTGAEVAATAEGLIASPTVDAVAICSPTDTHVDLILAAAAAGKAIFCEKPLAMQLGDIDRALAAVADAGVMLMVGFNRRFDPSHRAVFDAVHSGRVGEPHLVRITSRDPAPPPVDYIASSGGMFLDMTIHDFDMARFVSGSEVREVFAQGAVRIDPVFATFGDVDTAVVVLRHENGCITTIDNSRRAVYGYDQRVEVLGSEGMAASNNPLASTTVVSTADAIATETLPHFFLERYQSSYAREWEAFVHAWSTGAPSPVGGADGRAAIEIGLAAAESLRLHRPVSVGAE
jgi:myo-inositol 2-dehydrogenase/D-chiro-inositol 1-dehydrogenase